MKNSIQQNLDKLVSLGMVVSFVYGHCGNKGIWWSVDVLTLDGKTFERPYLANSLEHAIEIIFNECRERGWLDSAGLCLINDEGTRI